MTFVYAATYQGDLLGTSRSKDLWKIGCSSNPSSRINNTTGTIRTSATLHKVWKGRGAYEYDAIRAAQRAFSNGNGEWFTAPRRHRKRVLSVISRAIATAHAASRGIHKQARRKARGTSERDIRHRQRTRTRRAVVPQRFDPSN